MGSYGFLPPECPTSQVHPALPFLLVNARCLPPLNSLLHVQMLPASAARSRLRQGQVEARFNSMKNLLRNIFKLGPRRERSSADDPTARVEDLSDIDPSRHRARYRECVYTRCARLG